MVYIGAAGDLHELVWDPAPGKRKWFTTNLTDAADAPAAIAGSALTSYVYPHYDQQHVTYVDSNNKLRELYYDRFKSWRHADLTEMTGSPAPLKSTPLTSYTWDDQQHVVYIDKDNAVRHLHYRPVPKQWLEENLTGITGAAKPTTPSALTSYTYHDQQHIVYVDVNNHVHEFWYKRGAKSWQHKDLMASP